MRIQNDNNTDNRKWLVLTVIVIKMVIDGLDASMLNIALPSIGRSLGATSSAVVWSVSIYAMIAATTTLFFGRLGDMIGKTKLYLIGIVIYLISTIFSGTANSLPMFIVSRAIQAVGAACTMANSQGIIIMTFPEHQRGRALGFYGAAISIGTLAGPTLGGLIVAYMSWRFIFLLKIPIALLAVFLGYILFPKDVPERKEKMDYPGAFLFVVALIPLLYSLQEGYSVGFTHVSILLCLALSIIAFIVFFIVQHRKTMPLLDLKLFKNPIYSIGISTAAIMQFSNASRNIIIPYYMQGVLGIPVEIAGLYMSISPILVLIVAPVSGYFSDKIGSEKLALVGQIINFAGVALMMTLSKESPVMTLIAFFCIASFGSALFTAPNNSQIMSNVPRDKLGIGGSANMCIRNVGISAGLAFATAALYGGMSRYLGYNVVDYVKGAGMDDAFIYGMRSAYLISSLVCVSGIIASATRLILSGKKKTPQITC